MVIQENILTNKIKLNVKKIYFSNSAEYNQQKSLIILYTS